MALNWSCTYNGTFYYNAVFYYFDNKIYIFYINNKTSSTTEISSYSFSAGGYASCSIDITKVSSGVLRLKIVGDDTNYVNVLILKV